MKNVSLKNVTVLGELGHRLLRSCMRLESDIYIPDKVYQPADYGWPADWEGRALLALVRQMEATHREPSYLREILRGVCARMNEKGYLGRILPAGYVDEQQISGHNWLLRALLEYTKLTGSTEAREAAQRLINNLYLPLKGRFAFYPTDPEQRVMEGNPDGNLTGDCINGWYLSTDIGCAFMSLDALGMAYRDFGQSEVKELLDEMISEFEKIDFFNASMQTHATLSGIRGIIWTYEASGDKKYYDLAARLFEMYLNCGISENYANHNWFGRPLWTEPCAIIDSFMDAMLLYRLSEDVKWLEAAHKIYYNAMLHAQRPNGGFGCDSCAGSDGTVYLTVQDKGMDASWCCSMRGGEGLAEAAKNIALVKDGVPYFVFYHNAEIRFDDCTAEIITGYPYTGNVEIRLTGRPAAGKIALYLPSYAQNGVVCVNGERSVREAKGGFITVEVGENGVVTLDIPMSVEKLPCKAYGTPEGYYKLTYGFMLLGVETTSEVKPDISRLVSLGGGMFRAGEVTLGPIGGIYKKTPEELAADNWQLLFRE